MIELIKTCPIWLVHINISNTGAYNDFENGETNLEPLDGHAKDREEAGDDGDDEESVDQLVLEWLDELVFDRMAGHHNVGLSEGSLNKGSSNFN